MANDFKTAQPLEYYKHFLKENVRPDGRNLLEFRKTLLNIGTINSAYGSAVLKLGHTMVSCGITAELAEPPAETPDIGYFVPNVELPPLCSPEFRPGPPDDKAQILSQVVLDVITNSGLLNLEDLCIEEKKLSWVVYADVVCMSHDGNLLDAVLTVLYAALRNTRLPRIQINEESKEVEHIPGATFKLKLHSKPVSTTIAVFDESTLFVDPSHEEEDLSQGTISIVVGSNKDLYAVYKPGGCAVDDKVLKKCIEAALVRHNEVCMLLDEVQEDIVYR